MATGRKLAIFLFVALVAAGSYLAVRMWHLQAGRASYEAAMRLYADKKYTEAARALRVVSEAYPRTAEGVEAFYYHCICLEMSGQREKTKEAWQAIIRSPESKDFHPQAAFALARMAFHENRIDEAERRLDKLNESCPGSPVCADGLLLRAGILEKKGDIAGAARAAQKVVDDYPGSRAVARAQEKVWELNVKLLFSPLITPGTEEYVVRPGDSLEAIARKFGTTIDLLKAMNAQVVKGDSIRPKDRLKVCAEKFSILVDKSSNTLALKQGERVVKVYSVGTGKGGSTPVGEFKITNKMVEPEWFKPGGGVVPYGDPENLLGTRWMGIDSPGYGIHGTWEPETIGKQASAGCIRMLNADVEEIFKIVPLGTRVRVVD
jgi:lipoprotein-anchoring transpeptidase ErfK/SrfK/predicted negative regulator of RcsB-dependent stress response